MNGVMIGPDTQKNIDALKKADWLVVGEIYPDETSEFWRAPGISTDEMKQIKTTVYRLPCAGFAEKDGSMTNSARWLQWKNAALPPPGDCRLDQDILAQIFLKIRALYQKDGGKFPDPVLHATWAYTDPQHPSLSEVSKEINGKALADLQDPVTKQEIKGGQQVPGFAWLRTTEPRHVGTGYIPAAGRRRGLYSPVEERKILPGSVFIRIGRGRGQRIGVFCITALPAILTASPGTLRANKFGGMRAPRNGSAMMFPISSLTLTLKITWARSS